MGGRQRERESDRERERERKREKEKHDEGSPSVLMGHRCGGSTHTELAHGGQEGWKDGRRERAERGWGVNQRRQSRSCRGRLRRCRCGDAHMSQLRT